MERAVALHSGLNAYQTSKSVGLSGGLGRFGGGGISSGTSEAHQSAIEVPRGEPERAFGKAADTW